MSILVNVPLDNHFLLFDTLVIDLERGSTYSPEQSKKIYAQNL